MKRWAALCVGVGMLAGCGGAPEQSSVTTSPVATGTSAAPAPVSSVPPGAPLGSAAYQSELTRIDQALAGPLRALTRVRTPEGLTAAMFTLSAALDTVASRLAELTVTSRVTAVHQLLQDRIGVASDSLSNTDRFELNARCGGAAYTAQTVQRTLRADLNGAIVPLARLKLTFGSTLPSPGPTPKAERPANGKVSVRRGPVGDGRLKITNGTAQDVALSVVTEGKPPASPQVMIFIRAGKSATINRIGGAYRIYYTSGNDWNSTRLRFGEDCSFQKFDQTFGRNEGWAVSLEPTVDGNAKTSQVDAY
jgi:hypothetical protein